MVKHESKYFGEIICRENDDENYKNGCITVKYNNQKINFLVGPPKEYGDKLHICFNIIDNYFELNEAVRKYILNNEEEDTYWIKRYIRDEDNISIFVEELNSPSILFEMVDNKIMFWLKYNIIVNDAKLLFSVEFNEKLEIVECSITEGYDEYDENIYTESYISEMQNKVSNLMDKILVPMFSSICDGLFEIGIDCEYEIIKKEYGEDITFSIFLNNEQKDFTIVFSYTGFDVIDRKQVMILLDVDEDEIDDSISGYYNIDEINDKKIREFILAFVALYKQDYPIEEIIEAFKNNKKPKRERIPEAVRHAVWRRDEGKCVKCGSNEKLEFDHIIPIIKGGSNTERNIQLLCEPCNRQKSDKI